MIVEFHSPKKHAKIKIHKTFSYFFKKKHWEIHSCSFQKLNPLHWLALAASILVFCNSVIQI